MSSQFIIALGREFGSGGHEIAQTLASHFALPLYDENILNQIAQSLGLDAQSLAQYDELPKNRLLYRTVNGFSNAPEDVIAQMQVQYLKARAAAGESFVVVGRCAEEVLKDVPGLITIFILADSAFKIERTMAHGPISAQEAMQLITQKDRKRRRYHNQYCKGKWGAAKNFDLAINSGRLGVPETAIFLQEYIKARAHTGRP